MQPTPAFAECYPQEIVDWIAAFPEPCRMTPHQHRIVKIIDDPYALSCAGVFFSSLDNCSTPTEANGMIATFRKLIEDCAAIDETPAMLVGRLAAIQ